MLYYQVVNIYHQGDYPRKRRWVWDIDDVACQLD